MSTRDFTTTGGSLITKPFVAGQAQTASSMDPLEALGDPGGLAAVPQHLDVDAR